MSVDTTQQQEAGRASPALRAALERNRGPALVGTYRRSINTLIGRLQDRAAYLSDEQRTQLRALAAGRAEE